MPIRSTALVAAAVLVAATVPAALAPAGAAAPTKQPEVSASSDDDAVVVRLSASDGQRTWTRARMDAAQPLPLPAAERSAASTSFAPVVAGPASQVEPTAPTAPAPTDPSARATGPTSPRTVGKLYFDKAGGRPFVCSAAVVAHPTKKVIVTAAHCVADAGEGTKGYHKNFVFRPAYASGSAPYGSWKGTAFVTYKGWLKNKGDYARDNAFITLAKNADDKKIEQVTGGNGMKFNLPAAGTGNKIWGWPAEKPYNGETVQKCIGTSSSVSYNKVATSALNCKMNGGASGGPWFRPQTSKNRGFVYTVSSRRTASGTPQLLAVPFSTSTKRLYDKIG